MLGEAALAGRNKLTLIADPELAAFGSWLEQLIAESTGKKGKGIVVIDGETTAGPSLYQDDRLFIHLKINKEPDPAVEALKQSNHPVLEFVIPDILALSREFYRWEVATAVACHILGVNAFDQPDVQDAKTSTLRSIAEYKQNGKLIEPQPVFTIDGIKVFLEQLHDLGNSPSIRDVIQEFLQGTWSLGKPNDKIMFQSFIQ